jgi:hypothetical protein
MDAAADLIAFTEYTFKNYQTAEIHRVEQGEVDRLMLLVASEAWQVRARVASLSRVLSRQAPERQLISASAGVTLAEDFGRDVRNIIAGPQYACLFDTRLAEDSQARGRWNTSQGGAYFAAGVGSQVMGRGAHVFMIDDPFGTMADARSELERKNVWDWYTGTVYNRLEKNGAIVLINHRMHEDDLTGMLLAQQAAGGDRWEVVELKPDMENNKALWPEKYPIEALQRIRRNSNPQDWSACHGLAVWRSAPIGRLAVIDRSLRLA